MAGGLEVDRYVIGIRVAGEVQVDRGAQRRPAGGWSGRERREEVGESDASPPGDRAPSLDAHQPRDLLVVREAPEQIADRQVLEATRGEARDPQRPGGQVLGARRLSVVVVGQRRHLGTPIGAHPAVLRVEGLRDVVVEGQGAIERSLAPLAREAGAGGERVQAVAGRSGKETSLGAVGEEPPRAGGRGRDPRGVEKEVTAGLRGQPGTGDLDRDLGGLRQRLAPRAARPGRGGHGRNGGVGRQGRRLAGRLVEDVARRLGPRAGGVRCRRPGLGRRHVLARPAWRRHGVLAARLAFQWRRQRVLALIPGHALRPSRESTSPPPSSGTCPSHRR